MTISVGFAGTQLGMSTAQYHAVRNVMLNLVKMLTFDAHHGDRVGADAEFHQICTSLHPARALVRIHPGPPTGISAGCVGFDRLPCRPYATCNRDIVRASTVMIAAPYEDYEQIRGGPWQTIRMAQQMGKPMAIVYRSGRVVRERWPQQAAIPVDDARFVVSVQAAPLAGGHTVHYRPSSEARTESGANIETFLSIDEGAKN